MTKIIEKEKERIRKVAHLLYDGARPVRILRSIDWPPSVKQGFFAKGAKELPVISYPGFDAKPTIDIVREARRLIIPFYPIDLWLERQANSIETGARMLAGIGTPVFFENSRQAYGEPTAPLRYLPVTSAGARAERSRRHRPARPHRYGCRAFRPFFRRGRCD